MEVLYHIRWFFVGIFPDIGLKIGLIYGRYLQNGHWLNPGWLNRIPGSWIIIPWLVLFRHSSGNYEFVSWGYYSQLNGKIIQPCSKAPTRYPSLGDVWGINGDMQVLETTNQPSKHHTWLCLKIEDTHRWPSWGTSKNPLELEVAYLGLLFPMEKMFHQPDPGIWRVVSSPN